MVEIRCFMTKKSYLEKLPNSKTKSSVVEKMIKQVDRCFFQDYHFRISQMVKDDSWSSKIELVSKFSGFKLEEKIQPSIEQFSQLFGDILII